jgi:hypothetical protein
VLTASEVVNFCNNNWNILIRPTLSTSCLLDVDAYDGSVKDRTGLRTLTLTDVSVVKHNGHNVTRSNGSTTKIDTGSDWVGTKAITICCWVKPRALGEGNNGVIVTNSKLHFANVSMSYQFASDYVSFVYSAANRVTLGKYQFLSVTRELDGKASFYIGSLRSGPALSGPLDQNSGTPIAGTTSMKLLNNHGSTYTYDGILSKIFIYEGILTIDQITNIWSSTLNYIR